MSGKTAVDNYIQKVIGEGDLVSNSLERVFAHTLKNSPLVDIVSSGMNGVKVARLPKGHDAVVHCASGNSNIKEPKAYCVSAVENLLKGAEEMGVEPVGFADVIDAPAGDWEKIKPFAETLAEQADKYHLSVLNGEFAVLGNRVTSEGNISLTMLSHVSQLQNLHSKNVKFAVFDPAGDAIYMNSDGVGTKTEFYERSGLLHRALRDSLAMKLDDLVKLGATARVVGDVVEIAGTERDWINVCAKLESAKRGLESGLDMTYLLQFERADGRIASYKPGHFALNISGTSVSTIDETTLKNLPHPSAGEYLVAIRGMPNPRSNGITDKRKLMIEKFGLEWHETEEGRKFMEFLGEPSTIFYNSFSRLLNQNFATSVYHMSGGAFNGKLARPLAKHNLFVELRDLFAPDERELEIARFGNTSLEVAYAKWPMGNEGFVTTKRPEWVINTLKHYGLEAREVGQLEMAENGRTGVEFRDVKTANGERLYFRGKD